MDPRFPDFERRSPTNLLVPVLYTEVEGNIITRTEFSEGIREMPWHATVAQIVGIYRFLWMYGMDNELLQYKLVTTLAMDLTFRDQLTHIINNQLDRVVFTPEALIVVLRALLAEGRQDDEKIGLSSADKNNLVKAVLIANDFIAFETAPVMVTNTLADMRYSEIRSALHNPEHAHILIARTKAFFDWTDGPKAKASTNFLNIRKDFERFCELSLDEYLGAAYLMLARYGTISEWNGINPSRVFFNMTGICSELKSAEVFRKWITKHTVVLDELKEGWRTEESLSLAAAGILWRKPIIQTAKDQFLVPFLTLVENALGDGVFFLLLDEYREHAEPNRDSRAHAVEKFTRFYSEFFEDYVAAIFESAYSSHLTRRYAREHFYEVGKLSTDIIVAEGENILFIEVVAKRMTLLDSTMRLSASAIRKDIEVGIIEKARQLDHNIKQYRNGVLLPDWPRSPNQRIFPVIISPRQWPRVSVIATDIASREAEGLFKGCEPLELISVDELESIDNEIRDTMSLAEVLKRKNSNETIYRIMSLTNYLIFTKSFTHDPMSSATYQRGSAMAKELIELVGTWFS